MFAGQCEPVLAGLGIAAAHQVHGLLEPPAQCEPPAPKSRLGRRPAPTRRSRALDNHRSTRLADGHRDGGVMCDSPDHCAENV
jgi:hypothetical protein